MTINWEKIEYLMLKSFTGSTLSEEEQKLVEKAHKANPKEYGERHQRIKSEEIARRRLQ